MAISTGSPEKTPRPLSTRFVRFRLRDREYAVPLSSVSGLAEIRPIREVPGAPAGVLGITEWRGRLFTVLDLAALLGDGPGEGPGCLIRLAEPYGATALFVAANVTLARVAGAAARDTTPTVASPLSGTLDIDGVPVTMLEPRALVAELAGFDGRA